MAQTEHLPIYKATYDLCLHLEQVVAKFARTHRYGLGSQLREGARGGVLRTVVREPAPFVTRWRSPTVTNAPKSHHVARVDPAAHHPHHATR
jgi:hypothetical protein